MRYVSAGRRTRPMIKRQKRSGVESAGEQFFHELDDLLQLGVLCPEQCFSFAGVGSRRRSRTDWSVDSLACIAARREVDRVHCVRFVPSRMAPADPSASVSSTALCCSGAGLRTRRRQDWMRVPGAAKGPTTIVRDGADRSRIHRRPVRGRIAALSEESSVLWRQYRFPRWASDALGETGSIQDSPLCQGDAAAPVCLARSRRIAWPRSSVSRSGGWQNFRQPARVNERKASSLPL